MPTLSRRDLLLLSLAASAGLARAEDAESTDVHHQLLDMAARQEGERRARFAAVKTKGDLDGLQDTLRKSFLRLLDGFPERKGVPHVTKTGRIEAEDYVVEKLVYESLPGYFVPALLYRPKELPGPVPAVLSPCGHSAVGKAEKPYQILHINLAKRGFVVLTYDPVGQGERSQFWDAAKQRTRYNLGCGEHAVMGNSLYLLGTNLARYRIWDGMRGLDYLASRPEVDATKLGCAGNSGGGTLTAYIAALDRRVTAAATCCYITTLPRRMANRIQEDPSSDPEQDIFGFVSEGIDHAGLLALCAPRPTLVGSAVLDFFPIAGARESFAEAKRLYEIAGAGERIAQAEAQERHGLTRPLREAVYGWFNHWLAGRENNTASEEIPVSPRAAEELRVCGDGQVNVTFRSRHLLTLALEESRKARRPPPKTSLRKLLRLDPAGAHPHITEITRGAAETLVACINGNDTPDWRAQGEFLRALERAGLGVVVIDPRGIGAQRSTLAIPGHAYADPISSVEANIAYNAFLVGHSLLGLRVADVLAAVERLNAERKPRRLVLCGRRDAALVACFAAAVEPKSHAVASEEMLTSFLPMFSEEGSTTNASNIVPGLLSEFGDLPDVLAQIAPRRVLVARGTGSRIPNGTHSRVTETRFTEDPRVLIDWLGP
jgi:cephalosporin-C deacetylase-like acetyl esterase